MEEAKSMGRLGFTVGEIILGVTLVTLCFQPDPNLIPHCIPKAFANVYGYFNSFASIFPPAQQFQVSGLREFDRSRS